MSRTETSRNEISPGRLASRFARVREARQTELAEDYVELIEDLVLARGEARAADLAECFGVSPATVARAIQRLARDGLVVSEPYRAIFLTDEGRRIASIARARHRLVRDFLLALGVGKEAAESDAEGIEHHVGPETLKAFQAFLAQLQPAPSRRCKDESAPENP
ncbi:MAG: manganese-binding transcriptional regulator MntR [Fulvimarina manganoxydans]|uniref:manganese-binding transcriptional regulator MntR n=1 Tax=Fulvimarina manganoxydans TaxID=937218 RepID=UPI0023546D6D|nr:manganese-binding transcriptional regulator MntR [Fulvimarina manganoxydans]MCK5932220.1 manganese-binding transcriptional regulator MntR [Fulvimarina manganoxydans]